MKTKYEVRSGKWKDVIETENWENIKHVLRTKLLTLPENCSLGYFIFVKEAKKRGARYLLYCSTSEVLSY